MSDLWTNVRTLSADRGARTDANETGSQAMLWRSRAGTGPQWNLIGSVHPQFMASMIIEEESGTFTSTGSTTRTRPHNGYSAGRFSEPSSPDVLARWFAWGRATAGSTTLVTAR